MSHFADYKLGIVMDAIDTIKPHKDSSVGILSAAQKRGCTLYFMEPKDLFVQAGKPGAWMRPLKIGDDLNKASSSWATLGDPVCLNLKVLDGLLMRKDPPVDTDYLCATYLLQLAQSQGLTVINDPSALRDVNEKLYTTWFPHCCPPTLVSANSDQIKDFIKAQNTAILKPLFAMGGAGIFKFHYKDPNVESALEMLTNKGKTTIMAQRFIPEITQGDKRILLIEGQPIPQALARIPPAGQVRANLAVGGRGNAVPLNERDAWICEQVGPTLKAKGLLLVGLDVIGDYLTEINVTSPTCIRELEAQCDLNISDKVVDMIQACKAEACLSSVS